ncbi:hypothetical protein FHK87_09995 [Aquimarina algicola]|uniref:Beta-carotene 15,15'-monooxygenase n=2 Tax=Aquimarina algicola TaxID=2589995 RepID=A0A504JHK7_9FLAO|nr:hypothetical protein FHK87_09995 [Aquimarina algicola]
MAMLFGLFQFKKGFPLQKDHIFLLLINLIAYISPILLLNLIAQKNDLTTKGTYTILLYSFLTAILPEALMNYQVLISNIFVLFGLRSVLHLRNEKHIKAKVFNASLLIGIATLFYFWSIGFIILVFAGIFFFEPKNYRNWIIPLVGFAAIYIFANCFMLLFFDSFYTITNYVEPISLSFEEYFVRDRLFSIGVLSICILFFFSLYLIKFGRKPANSKTIIKIIIIYLIVAIGVVLIVPNKNTSELIFVCAPLAIIATTYLEMEYHSLVKEINIWVFLFIPFLLLLL